MLLTYSDPPRLACVWFRADLCVRYELCDRLTECLGKSLKAQQLDGFMIIQDYCVRHVDIVMAWLLAPIILVSPGKGHDALKRLTRIATRTTAL